MGNIKTNQGEIELGEAPKCHKNADGDIDCPNGHVTMQMKTTATSVPFSGGLVVFHCTQDQGANAEPNVFNSKLNASKSGETPDTTPDPSDDVGGAVGRRKRSVRSKR